MPAIDATLSTTYYLNFLAGTIVNGWPSRSAPDAARIWTDNPATFTIINSYNEEAGNTLPNFEAAQGVVNNIANTMGLTVHDALRQIILALP